jgi:hypothetical protein
MSHAGRTLSLAWGAQRGRSKWPSWCLRGTNSRRFIRGIDQHSRLHTA